MLDQKVRDLINAQVAKEFYSGYLYLDFANLNQITRSRVIAFHIS